ncbi:MAG: shikimate kinase [Pseudomonadota bacterium]
MAAECPESGARPGNEPAERSRQVVLIGYRCSGKTSVGRILAARLGWSFADTDAEVEREAGRGIAQIVAGEGWPGFRERERRAVASLAGRGEIVIAAGGGAALDAQNRREWSQSGAIVVYLVLDAETAAARLAADPQSALLRPSLSGCNAACEVQQVLAEREPVYHDAASWRIEVKGRGVAEIAAELGRLLQEMEG